MFVKAGKGRMHSFGLDVYSLRARLQPTFIVLFPIFFAIPIWAPEIYKLGATLIGLFATCGITLILSELSRSFGLKAQDKLIEEWGGLPSTIWLRHNDSSIDRITKKRYHNSLSQKISHWTAPSASDENNDPKMCDEIYISAVRWLRENTRDRSRFNLIFKENMSYGFRRNTYGWKPVGILVCLLSIALALYQINGTNFIDTLSSRVDEFIYLLVVITLLLWWMFIVSGGWVKSGANSYARALLAACDN